MDKKQKESELVETLQSITDIFLSLLAVIDSTKLHSSDYLVCSIIVEYMNDRFNKKWNADLSKYYSS